MAQQRLNAKKRHKMLHFSLFLQIALLISSAFEPASKTLENWNLEGRWEVVEYSEQGLQVNKKQDPLLQAKAVYEHVREIRAHTWFGYIETEEANRRLLRAYDRWEERDSTAEVKRVAEAIAMPYFVVFFADSTLSSYNKALNTNQIYFAEARHYIPRPATKSCDMTFPGATAPYNYFQWRAQVLAISEQRLTLFLPEEAEIVELVKTAYSLP